LQDQQGLFYQSEDGETKVRVNIRVTENPPL
jgi:hypothetical protein